ncbi:hypothetical protein HPB51_023536 [Rhipicephalus microplus]|uniref:MADF domain-containing protein n=1 Tax=Rhipicephalus microplus TaxID=6941 RepID=A0A9J6FA19_RHIMP|nr:hypothetical protein HPB51_023536 [Rhipicephalus microplus]
MDTERFLEEIRLYPFLYDKTMPDYKDKEAKMNRWDFIGSMFGLTGTQAMLKFKNIRDRWMKLVSGVEANTRSGAPGNSGKIKWPLFSIIDSMLRQTPHYAENISVPPKRMDPISSRRISRAATLKQQQTRHHGNVERCAEIVVACHCSHDCTAKSESSEPTLPIVQKALSEQTTKKRAKSRELRDRSRLLSRHSRRCGQRAAFHRSAAKTRVMPRRHASR